MGQSTAMRSNFNVLKEVPKAVHKFCGNIAASFGATENFASICRSFPPIPGKCSHKEISLLPRLHANEACKVSM